MPSSRGSSPPRDQTRSFLLQADYLQLSYQGRVCLQAMQEKKALSSRGRGRLRGFLELRCQCAVSDEVRREAQGAFHVAPGKSGLHAHGKGERVIALEQLRGLR